MFFTIFPWAAFVEGLWFWYSLCTSWRVFLLLCDWNVDPCLCDSLGEKQRCVVLLLKSCLSRGMLIMHSSPWSHCGLYSVLWPKLWLLQRKVWDFSVNRCLYLVGIICFTPVLKPDPTSFHRIKQPPKMKKPNKWLLQILCDHHSAVTQWMLGAKLNLQAQSCINNCSVSVPFFSTSWKSPLVFSFYESTYTLQSIHITVSFWLTQWPELHKPLAIRFYPAFE